jgi:hypothetical protein
MTAITEAINILETQHKPLAEKRKQIAISADEVNLDDIEDLS